MLEEQGAQGTQRTAWLSQGGDVLGRLPGRALREDGAACAGHASAPPAVLLCAPRAFPFFLLPLLGNDSRTQCDERGKNSVHRV